MAQSENWKIALAAAVGGIIVHLLHNQRKKRHHSNMLADTSPTQEWEAFRSMYAANLTASHAKTMEVQKALMSFLSSRPAGQPVVVVTSGGTAVPLEKKVVRFLDNFSSGGRGAGCASEFLAQGYAVVFVHRDSSIRPDAAIMSSSDFCSLPFFSVYEYLLLLELTCVALNARGRKAMVFLAAAVADFYLNACEEPDVMATNDADPGNRYQITVGMASDKIQSRDVSGLTLHLKNTPKMLKWVKGTDDVAGTGNAWSPDVFMVTFKLETDSDVLLAKASKSLKLYHQDVVVANMLDTYKTKTQLVFPATARAWQDINVQGHTVDGVRTEVVANEDPASLNRDLVAEVVRLHQNFMN